MVYFINAYFLNASKRKTRYGQIKIVNFIIDLRNRGYKIMKKRKLVVAERFIRVLHNKIYK